MPRILRKMLRKLRHHRNKAKKRIRRFLKNRPPLKAVPDIGTCTFLFIGGVHRSGTSVLHELLREHPDTSGFFKTGVMEDEGQHLLPLFASSDLFDVPGRFGLTPNTRLTETSKLTSNETRDTILKGWGAYYDLQKKVLLEKSPPNMVRSRFFQALFPGSQFVFIIRHPVASSLAVQKWNQSPIVSLILNWYAAHQTLLLDLAHIQNSLVIRYEDFVVNRDAYLGQICHMVDLTKFTPKLELSDHNSKYFEIWENHHTADKAMLESHFPNVIRFIEALGYSLDAPFVAPAPTNNAHWIADPTEGHFRVA